MIDTAMRAIRIEEYGGPAVMALRTIPIPMPGAEEVLVKVSHAGINFMDIHTRQGKYRNSRTYPVPLPCTLGVEGAGVVVETGKETSPFTIGDRVAWCISWGSYADYAVVPVSKLAKVPAALPLEIASAVLFHGCTAHYLVHDVGRLQPGMSCLVHGASGGIGQMLVQMASRLGAAVYATTSSDERSRRVRSLGAGEVFGYDGGRFADRIRHATAGRGVDVVFDALGKDTLRDSLRATRTRGLVVNYGSVSGSAKDLDPIELGEAGSLYLTRPRLADHLADQSTVQRRADAIFAAVLLGHLEVTLAGRYRLETVQDGLNALERRRSVGKPLLVLGGEA